MILSEELICAILSLLDIPSIARFSETCKAAYEICKKDQIWEPINWSIFTGLNCAPLPRIAQEPVHKFVQRRLGVRRNWYTGGIAVSPISASVRLNFLQVDPGNRNLLTTASNTDIMEWDLTTGQQLSSFHSQTGCIHFCLDSDRLAISGSDTVRVYDRVQKNYLYQLTGLFSYVNRIKISQDLLVAGWLFESISCC